jgi:hypothetical protein
MRKAVLTVLLMGGCLWLPAQTVQPALPSTTAPNSEPAVTRAQLEQRLIDLKAGKEQAVANVNAFEGAIQECSHWLDILNAAEQSKKTDAVPAPKK